MDILETWKCKARWRWFCSIQCLRAPLIDLPCRVFPPKKIKPRNMHVRIWTSLDWGSVFHLGFIRSYWTGPSSSWPQLSPAVHYFFLSFW
jgi:hypothetical protein